MIHLVVSGLNYSKEVSPCQVKEENKHLVLDPYKGCMLSGKYHSPQNGKDLMSSKHSSLLPIMLQTVVQCSPDQQALPQLPGHRVLATVLNSQCNDISQLLCDEFLKRRNCSSKNPFTVSS